MPEHMDLEKLYNMLREEDERKYLLAEEGGPEVSDMDFDPMMTLNVKAKSLFNELLISADEDIMNKINELVKKICQKVRIHWYTSVYLVIYWYDFCHRYFPILRNTSIR